MKNTKEIHKPFHGVLPSKLSKACLFMLTEGFWLMSNTMHSWREPISRVDGEVKYRIWNEPIYLEQVSPLSQREEQWKRIKKARVNHRHFHLVSSKKEAYIYLNGTTSDNAFDEHSSRLSFDM